MNLKMKEINIICKLLIKKSSTIKCRINEPSVHENYQNLQYQGLVVVVRNISNVVVNNLHSDKIRGNASFSF